MYYLAIQQFVRTLKNLNQILGKAEVYAKARQFNVDNFCQARIAPDMLPFLTQVQIACDTAKVAAANLSGTQAPKHEDDEKTIGELRERIAKCLGYLEGLRADDFQKTTPQTKVLASARSGKFMLADDFLFGRQIPNFFFHVTTAYALLRQGGVDVGKKDYLGQLPLLDS